MVLVDQALTFGLSDLLQTFLKSSNTFTSLSFSVTLQPRLHNKRAYHTNPVSAALTATKKAACPLVELAAALLIAAALTLAAMKNTSCKLHVLWKMTKTCKTLLCKDAQNNANAATAGKLPSHLSSPPDRLEPALTLFKNANL